MRKPAALTVISADLPEYPIGRDQRLDGNSFVKWHTGRWLASRTFKMMDWANQGMARALFDLCQNENPVGTLPNDDDELGFMLRVEPRRMRELRALDFGPLRNWVPCQSQGEVRLMHPVVVGVIQDALERREMAALSKEEKAVAMRLDRLRKALLAEGLDPAVVHDEMLVLRLDDWLLQTHKGNRIKAVYRSAILHAATCGWFGEGFQRPSAR